MERIPLNKHLILRHGSLEFEREDITIYMLTHNLSIVIRPAGPRYYWSYYAWEFRGRMMERRASTELRFKINKN
jgi:hypothetical protein